MLPKDLNIFGFEESLIGTLKPLQLNLPNEPIVAATTPTQPSPLASEEGSTCTYCGPITVEPWKLHYKSDFHRFNVKQKLQGKKILSETDFEKIVENSDNESISGSDTEDEADNDPDEGSQHSMQRSPFFYYTSEKLPSGKCLSVYKNAVDSDDLRKLDPSGHSLVIMIGGGHFAATIFKHKPTRALPTSQNPYVNLQILAHKTFHRYTTRRKQGGAQSAMDNAKGKANSAGSSLRRYNEAALTTDVRELLNSWKELVNSASHIYIRASGKANRAVIMGYDAAPIASKDPRIRSLPFTTKRATANETKRAWLELVRAKLVDIPQAKPSESAKAPVKPVSRPITPSSKPVDNQSPDDKHTGEIISLIKKSKAPKLIMYLKSNKLMADFELSPKSKYLSTPTPLFYASHEGVSHIVTTLLVTLSANPTLENAEGKTPFEVASTRSVKDAFQLARATLTESKWDWQAARVGPALTKEDIDARNDEEHSNQQKERQDALAALDAQERQNAAKIANKNYRGEGRSLAGGVVTELTESKNLRGLSADARIQLERERRARAAEARFKKAQG